MKVRILTEVINISEIHKIVQWLLKLLTFSLSSAMLCGFVCSQVHFFPLFSGAVNCVEGKGRTIRIQHIEKVEVVKHLPQIIWDIKILILNFSDHSFRGKNTMVQYRFSFLKNTTVNGHGKNLKYSYCNFKLVISWLSGDFLVLYEGNAGKQNAKFSSLKCMWPELRPL